MVIQQLLVDAGAKDLDMDLVIGRPPGAGGRRRLAIAAVARDLPRVRAEQRVRVRGRPRSTTARTSTREHRGLQLNSWDLTGDWTVARHAAVLERARWTDHLRASTRATSTSSWARRPPGAAIPFRVSLDGRAVEDAHGTDVDADGRGVVDDQNTYQLIRQSGRDRRPRVRDRVPRGRGGGVLLHVRVIGARGTARGREWRRTGGADMGELTTDPTAGGGTTAPAAAAAATVAARSRTPRDRMPRVLRGAAAQPRLVEGATRGFATGRARRRP